MLTSISVMTSGGVIMAATSMMTMKAWRRKRANILLLISPIFVRKKATTGSWNTSPMMSVSEVKVET